MCARNILNKVLVTMIVLAHSYWIAPTASARSRQLCLQCLYSEGCNKWCNCHCPPGYSGYAQGCDETGSPNYTCSNTSTNPPSYAYSICDGPEECDNPECAPLGWYCDGTQLNECCPGLACNTSWGQCCGATNYSCTQDAECCPGLVCNQISGQCSTNPSPILIDLKSNTASYHLTASADGVAFDLDTDGTREQIAWTEATSPVVFLSMDRNHNDRIDDGSELFGTYTRLSDGSLAANGFDALLDLDGGPGVSDGQIDSHDPAYDQLRVWHDRNHNGISEPDELATLIDTRIVTIFTSYRSTPRVDRYGNRYLFEGSALITQNSRVLPRKMFDVVFATAK